MTLAPVRTAIALLVSISYANAQGAQQPGAVLSFDSLLGRTLSNETAGASLESGTRVHWVEPPMLLQKPTDQVALERMYNALNLLVDAIPLSSVVYVPTLDRISSIFEEALFDPRLLHIPSKTATDEKQLKETRSALFASYSENTEILLSPSEKFRLALTNLGKNLSKELPGAGLEPFLSTMNRAVERYSDWAKDSGAVLTSAELLSSIHRRSNAVEVRLAKMNYEANLNAIGVPISKFSPELSSWFEPSGWRLAVPSGASSFWLREVSVVRPWFDVSIIAEAELRRGGARAFSASAAYSTNSTEALLAPKILPVPIGLVLLGEQGASDRAPSSVKVLGVIVQSYDLRRVKAKTLTLASLPTGSGSPKSLWEHNGSILRLVAQGTARSFIYERPREKLRDEGVGLDTTLFKGTAQDDTYSGTAYVFRANCKPFGYAVSGSILNNGRTVILIGKAPVVDAQCKRVGLVDDELVFQFRGGNDRVVSRNEDFVVYNNFDLTGGDFRIVEETDAGTCKASCISSSKCKGYTYDKWNRWCFLKTQLSELRFDPASLSAVKANSKQPQMTDADFVMERFRGKRFPGAPYRSFRERDFERCEGTCVEEERCVAFSYSKSNNRCSVFSEAREYSAAEGVDSGVKRQPASE